MIHNFMWYPLGQDKYHMTRQRKELVYIQKSTISDSMWGIFSGRKEVALEGDVMCNYHSVRYEYNILTAPDKPLKGNKYTWYNGGVGNAAIAIDGRELHSSYRRYANGGNGESNAEIIWPIKNATVMVLKGCNINPCDEIFIQYPWDYRQNFIEDDMAQKDSGVYYDSLNTPAEDYMRISKLLRQQSGWQGRRNV